MNHSIDKLANLLLARKAIQSLPANTAFTVRELNSMLEQSCARDAMAMIVQGQPRATSSASSKLLVHRHPHQAPLSITSSSSFADATATATTSWMHVAIRQLSSTTKQ